MKSDDSWQDNFTAGVMQYRFRIFHGNSALI
jgi:hypothetical protein